ncbi:hypothetical protein C8Q73DRAFT_785330 [Cubamyces lactineus]|nr:hypothetical protein C8Q73DRAFT_785330 [Cubamyces lactineus]
MQIFNKVLVLVAVFVAFAAATPIAEVARAALAATLPKNIFVESALLRPRVMLEVGDV